MHSQTGIGIPRTFSDFGKVHAINNARRWLRLKVTSVARASLYIFDKYSRQFRDGQMQALHGLHSQQ